MRSEIQSGDKSPHSKNVKTNALNCRHLIAFAVGLAVAGAASRLAAHDVPDRSFDRAIQITIEPERVFVSYDLSLTQLTLAEELLALVGPGGLSGAGPSERMETYAQKMGPLVADGVLLRLDGLDAKLRLVQSSHRIDDHPRFHFELEVPISKSADERSLRVEDTNFFLEKGRIRIAVRAAASAVLTHSTVSVDLDSVRVRASWEVTPEQQDEARRAEARWHIDEEKVSGTNFEKAPETFSSVTSNGTARGHRAKLLALLDRWSNGFYVALLGLAFFFGAVHALTPGHGKTMVAAYLVGERGTLRHAVGLGLTTSLTHTSSVLLVALWIKIIGPTFEGHIHSGFALASGLLVAGLGACLLVVRLYAKFRPSVAPACGHGGCQTDEATAAADTTPHGPGWASLVTFGVSGGIVPCWDAVVLLLIAMAQSQVDRAVYLLLSFSAGLACALVLVGVLAVKMRGVLAGRMGSGRLVQSLPVFSAAAIFAVGVYLCARSLEAPAGTVTLSSPAANRMVAP
jgi:ABC-type nickel/cobalt efflux system permease component RcnA